MYLPSASTSLHSHVQIDVLGYDDVILMKLWMINVWQNSALTMANVKKSPPISSFIFFKVPTISRHGPHHSEYTSTTGTWNVYKDIL